MARNQELRTAWDFVENTGRSIFLTGKAGTGKTTFLKTVVERSRKRCIVVAPTGVAAINAGGVTIHSFFQLPTAPFVPDTKIKNRYDFSASKRRIIATLDLLIIDEISMVRSDLLDAIDSVLRKFRDHYKPFGGVQLLMIGDLQQLTPVVTQEDETILKPYYDTPYFFGSKALAQTDYVTIQLEKVYRQQDNLFIDILNKIRNGQADEEDLARLNSRCAPNFQPRPEEGYIRLTTHNRMADQHNDLELRRLTTPLFTFEADIKGTFPELSFPTNKRLVLKAGTQVMFVKNDPSPDHRYYNGRIGRVTRIDSRHIEVLCSGDTTPIMVERLVWENTQYTLNAETHEIESEVKGTFEQYPLRLAWAITIHKSQGLTFDRAIIDAGYSFAPGQVYVALSRCRTLEGMVLSSPILKRAIINDYRVDDYIAAQEQNAQKSIEMLPQLKEEYYRHLLLELFDFSPLLHLQESMVRVFIEYFSRSYATLELLQKQALDDFKTNVSGVAAKWRVSIGQAPAETLHEEAFLQRVRKSATYFAERLQVIFEKPLRLTADVKSNNKQAVKRLSNLLPELRQTWQSHLTLLRKTANDGFSITQYLKQKQLSLLDAMEDGPGEGKQGRKKKAPQPKTPKPPKEKTWVVSLRMFKQGLSIDAIARERELTRGTIINHLSKYLSSGEVSLDDLVSHEHQEAILKTIRLVGKDNGTTAIKSLCPPDITYDEIRLVLSSMEDSSS